ncbi:MAG: DUF1192 domain-containing protein [Alphaproteobacteria bacterium]|nr:DUF1192 domain-containing protein [Alphaproteobacteria bacterium]
MRDDDDLPRPKKSLLAPPPLLDVSIADLQAYVADLRAEIARAEAEIKRKEAQKGAAATLFKF